MAAVFFDVDGTLVRWPGEYRNILVTAFERCAGAPDEAWLDHYDDRFYYHFGRFVEDPYRRAFADVCERFSLDVDPAELADTLVECEFAAVEPVAGIETVLPELAERHALGVLTNGLPRVQFGKLRRHGLFEYFDVAVASHQPDVGATKPDAAIYGAAMERVDAETYVMVGDDVEPDVEGARRQGFVPVHVDATAGELRTPDFETLATLFG